MNCISRSNIPLKYYQIKVVKHILNPANNGLLVVHFCGMGKSLSAVASSQGYLDFNPKHNIVFIGGKSLIPNFKKEMLKYGITDYSKYSFYTYCKIMHMNKGDKLHEVLCNENTMLIIDEVHNLKSYKSKTCEAVLKLATKANKCLMLTATPFVNSLLDFIPLINFIHGKRVIGDSSQFRNNLVNDCIKVPKGSYVVGNNRDMMNMYLRRNVYYLNRITTSDYPTVCEQDVEVYMTHNYEKKYVQLMQSMEVNEIKFNQPNVFYNGHRRAVNTVNASNNETDDFSMKLKVMLPRIQQQGKTLIYTNWIGFGIDPITTFLKLNNISYRSFYGELTQKERAEIIKDYNDNKFKALIITSAGGEGIDLMETRNVIILDPTWNPTTLTQIKSRAIRYKSHSTLPPDQRCVNIYYTVLKAKTTVTGDVILYSIIKGKEHSKKSVDLILESLSI